MRPPSGAQPGPAPVEPVTAWATLRARFFGTPGARRIAENTLWLGVDRVGRLGVTLVLAVWLARSIGPGPFGLYSYVLAVTALAAAAAGLGLDGVVVRELVKEPARARELLGSAAALKLFAGLLAAPVCVAVVAVARPDDALALQLAALTAGTLLLQPADVVDFAFQARTEQKYAVIARGVAFVAFAGLKAWLISTRAGLVPFACATLGETAAGAGLLLVAYRARGGDRGWWRVRVATAGALLRDAWPLTLAALVVVVYMKAGQLMVGAWLGEAALGVYAAAARLAEVWYVVPMVVCASVFPSLVRAREAGPAEFARAQQRLYDGLGWSSLLLAVVLTAAAGPLISLVYGADYADAAPVLAILSWAAVFVFLGVGSSQFLLAENLTRVSLVRTAVGAAVNLAAGAVLIPRLGTRGAAWAVVLAYGSAVFAMVLDARTHPTVGRMLQVFNPLRLLGRAPAEGRP